MYDVNQARIENRLSFIPEVNQVLTQVQQKWNGDLCYAFAQERALVLAIEIVTDVGSDLIDGFMMREAASYTDIVEILIGEEVFPKELGNELIALVEQRDALVRHYVELDRTSVLPVTESLPDYLNQFADAVRTYLKNELW